MEISDLREFLALAKYGSFMNAAEECYITQSTLSKHMKRLEKELGYTLLERNSTGVSLSTYGKLTVAYARKIVNTEEKMQKTLKAHEKKLRETLTIGSTALMVPLGITSAISGFRKNYPTSSITIVDGEAPELTDKIQQRSLKLAFILVDKLQEEQIKEKLPDLVSVPFKKDVLSAVLPKDHPFASQQQIALEDLMEETFIFWSEQSYLYDLCYNYCSANQFEPDISLTSPRGQSIVDMVGENMGISIMPRMQAIRVNNPDITAIPLVPEEPLYVNLVYPKNCRFSEIESLFIKYLQSLASSSL